MKIQNIIISAVACFALVFGVLAYNKQPETFIGQKGEQGEKGLRGEKGDKGDSGQVLGAVNSPNVISQWFMVNGVKHYYKKMSLNSATTTVCSMQAPTEATSTLVYAHLVESVSSTTASIVDFAKSANTGATTSLIGTTFPTIAANTQAFLLATTTRYINDNVIFAPGNYFVANQKGGANNVFSPTGTCVAEWVLSL